MVSPTLVAAIAAILPAMAALWYLLRRYEAYFDDARVFISLTFGLFGGLLVTFLETVLFPFADPKLSAAFGIGWAFLLFVAGYAILESLAKAVVLGSKGYRTRKDTPYYGAALGLGFGAMAGLQRIARSLATADAVGNPYLLEPGRIASFLAMAALFLGGGLVHGGAGIYIGRECSQGKLWRGVAFGLVLQAPILTLYWLAWPSLGQGNTVVVLPAALAMAYGIGLLMVGSKRVLDTIVPPEIRKQVERDRRRAARNASQTSDDKANKP